MIAFLVRHADKADQGSDPPLSDAGTVRAGALATTLSSAELDHVHSSNFTRTRDTAAPTAAQFGLAVDLYDPHDLPAFAEQLRQTGGRHLVVGHSDTTPALAELLGAAPTAPFDEAGEFDRLYVVAVEGDLTSAVLLRYGAPFVP